MVEYALTEIPASKIWLGVPLYGYDWPLPFVQGRTKAQSISPQEAVARAVRYGVDIQYSEQAQAPWYRYTDGYGITHEVWFEDARSIQAKLALIPEYGLYGVGYWNLMRPFPRTGGCSTPCTAFVLCSTSCAASTLAHWHAWRYMAIFLSLTQGKSRFPRS